MNKESLMVLVDTITNRIEWLKFSHFCYTSEQLDTRIAELTQLKEFVLWKYDTDAISDSEVASMETSMGM
jgi:hypothetical protein